jgi:Ca2+/Na+ antiporter
VQIVYFTVVAIVLYFASDWLLERIEIRLERRLEHRSLIFFAILLSLALTSFSLIQRYAGNA